MQHRQSARPALRPATPIPRSVTVRPNGEQKTVSVSHVFVRLLAVDSTSMFVVVVPPVVRKALVRNVALCSQN